MVVRFFGTPLVWQAQPSTRRFPSRDYSDAFVPLLHLWSVTVVQFFLCAYSSCVVAKQLCSVRRKTYSPYFHALELTKWLWLDGSVGAFSGADGYNSLYRWRQRTIQELWWPLRRPQPQTTASERNRIRNRKNSNVSTYICLYENRKRQEKRNCTRWLDAFVVGCDEKQSEHASFALVVASSTYGLTHRAIRTHPRGR